MEITACLSLLAAGSLNGMMVDLSHIIAVGLGLGLVIFIHELGHFAVAKWCGVRVERFSIGFGPVLWRITRGETEYALSAIPFGGYVKMLGQDDADPSQLADQNIAKDPRSYTAKTVPQRIAIISAGVINNLVSAVLFFIIAFMFGVRYEPAIVGSSIPGMPAWIKGLRLGDELTRVDGRSDRHLRFLDVRQAVALSSGKVEIEGQRGGKPFRVTVEPTTDGLLPTIGLEPIPAPRLADLERPDASPTIPGSAAAEAQPPFRSGDEIVAVGDTPVADFAQLSNILARRRDETVEVSVRRKGQPADAAPMRITVARNPFRTLGLKMDIGKISAIQDDSPAARKGLQVGDKITHVIVKGKEYPVGNELDPLRLPDFIAEHHGQEITLRVKREKTGGETVKAEVTLVPDDRPGWSDKPFMDDAPLTIPAIGVACHVLHHVLKVEPGSPADGKIHENDNLLKLEFLPADEAAETAVAPKNDAARKDDALLFGETKRNWPMAVWYMQSTAPMKVRLTVKSQGSSTERTEVMVPQPAADWNLPMRGLIVQQLLRLRKAENIGEAVVLGFRHTRDSVIDMWLTIRSLASGRISPKVLGGPVAIAQAAYLFSKRGIPELILFLGMLSVNLAVLNFLPIPVLDGGHFVFLCWEGISGKPPSERVVLTANYVGLALVGLLMVSVLSLDFYRVFTGGH